jgi:hypothetical protein
VEVKWTLKGDANLDGSVGVFDLGVLASNFNAIPAGALWSQGDFDYSGTVDVGDLGLLSTNYNQTLVGGAEDPPAGGGGSADGSLSPISVGVTLPGSGGSLSLPGLTQVALYGEDGAATSAGAIVPEPASLSLLGLAGLATLGRRRHRRSQ